MDIPNVWNPKFFTHCGNLEHPLGMYSIKLLPIRRLPFLPPGPTQWQNKTYLSAVFSGLWIGHMARSGDYFLFYVPFTLSYYRHYKGAIWQHDWILHNSLFHQPFLAHFRSAQKHKGCSHHSFAHSISKTSLQTFVCLNHGSQKPGSHPTTGCTDTKS